MVSHYMNIFARDMENELRRRLPSYMQTGIPQGARLLPLYTIAASHRCPLVSN